MVLVGVLLKLLVAVDRVATKVEVMVDRPLGPEIVLNLFDVIKAVLRSKVEGPLVVVLEDVLVELVLVLEVLVGPEVEVLLLEVVVAEVVFSLVVIEVLVDRVAVVVGLVLVSSRVVLCDLDELGLALVEDVLELSVVLLTL